MSITVSGTAITFNDGTTQTTAASGGGLPSTYTGVGSTIFAVSFYNGGTISPGGTVSGSYLFYTDILLGTQVTSGTYGYGPGGTIRIGCVGNKLNQTASFTSKNIYLIASPTYNWTTVGVGTWMNVSHFLINTPYITSDCCNQYTTPVQTVWRRIS